LKHQQQHFSVGEDVEWFSGANGFGKLKRGRIVAIVRRGYALASAYPQLESLGRTFDLMAKDASKARDHESYLVLVEQRGTRMPHLYWPLVSQLRVQQTAATTPKDTRPRLAKKAS
jgi:hypothetical protein